MSAPEDREPEGQPGQEGMGLLSKLPRTRPQRSSPRRVAARARDQQAVAAPEPAGSNGHPPTRATSQKGKNAARATASAAGRRESGAKPAASSGAKARSGERFSRTTSARKASSAKGPAATRKAAAGARGPSKGSAGAAAKAQPRAPRQGFECETEHAGRTIHPPGGAELFASVTEIVGEFAKSGLSRSERLLRDALSRLPLG